MRLRVRTRQHRQTTVAVVNIFSFLLFDFTYLHADEETRQRASAGCFRHEARGRRIGYELADGFRAALENGTAL